MVNLFRRHQQTVMILVTIVIIVTFVGFYSHSDALDKGGSGRVAVNIRRLLDGNTQDAPPAQQYSRLAV